MSRLYRYHGSISEMMAQGQTAREITLYDSNDDRQAPTRLNVYGDLAKYIYELEMTDAEERYLNVDYYYDRLLTLVRRSSRGRSSRKWASSFSGPRSISTPRSRSP